MGVLRFSRTTIMLRVLSLFVLVAAVAADQCDSPDTDNAKCSCNGQEYDFSQIQPSDGNSYFSGPDANNEYMFYFQMTGGGLPSDDGSMPYCTFGAGTNTGNSAGQGEITGDSCFPIGLVAQQSWEIDTTQNPQVIQVTFSGGQEGRQTVLSVTCDPSADDPTFTAKGETRTQVYEVDVTSKFGCSGSPAPPSPPGPAPPSPPGPFPPSPGPPAPGPAPAPAPAKGGKGGTVFVAVTLGVGFGYLIFGFVYMHQVKKAEGWDRVPSREMWGGLFGLSKDGCKFLIGKVRPGSSYASL